MNELLQIPTSDLIPLNAFEVDFPVIVNVIYANETHPDNHFKNLYHSEAKILWAHKDMALVTLIAARICHDLYRWKLQVNDCLRPVEAQEKMAVYGYDTSLVSSPGYGGHPRAMAIDIEPIDIKTNEFINMGTAFDFFAEHPDVDNPAARDYTDFKLPLETVNQIIQNRKRLETAIQKAGEFVGKEIFPFPREWWDFRFPNEETMRYKALSETDLEPYQRLINPDVDAVKKILSGQYPSSVKSALAVLRDNVEKHLGALKSSKAL